MNVQASLAGRGQYRLWQDQPVSRHHGYLRAQGLKGFKILFILEVFRGQDRNAMIFSEPVNRAFALLHAAPAFSRRLGVSRDNLVRTFNQGL